MKHLNMDDKQFPPRSVLGYISRAKDAMLLAEEYLAECEASGGFPPDQDRQDVRGVPAPPVGGQRPGLSTTSSSTPSACSSSLRTCGTSISGKFRYVLIDEYQDTNHLQYLLASTAGGGISEFLRGRATTTSPSTASGGPPSRISSSFEQQYQGCRVIRLEENYRSTRHILEASNAVIRNNQGRKGKELWTKAGEGEKLTSCTPP